MSRGEPPFRAIAESTYDWETWIDESGTVRWMNDAVTRFTGLTPSECMARDDFPFVVVHPDDRDRVRELFRGALAGSTGNDVEFRLAPREGVTLWVAMSWQALADEAGGAKGLRTSVRDIHARKLAEERLRVAERQAATLARERTEFLATLSHELRSPLQCITGFAELVQRTPDDPSSERWLGIVRDQSDAVLRLVEDLLHFVAGERDELEPRADSMALAAIVEREVNAARPRVHEGVELRFATAVDPDERIVGDADHVRRVAANLIGNALRFTHAGFVDVRVEHRGSMLAILVEDTGTGMSAELLQRVRQPYVQGSPSTSQARGGVGLGLSIVESLLAAMGGALELESTPGVGTRVTALVPEVPRVRARVPSSGSDALHAFERTLLVLVVDDLAPARELVLAMLRGLGVGAIEAADGHDAIAVAREHAPDVVLVDYHMPGRDGPATLRAMIDEGVVGEESVTALLTANLLAVRAPETRAAGFSRVLTKPLRSTDLLSLLREAEARRATDPPLDREVLDELAVAGRDGASLLGGRTARIVEAIRAQLEALTACTDADGFRVNAHALAGIAASFGAHEVSMLARALEHGDVTDAEHRALRARVERASIRFARALAAFTGQR